MFDIVCHMADMTENLFSYSHCSARLEQEQICFILSEDNKT